MSNSVYSASTPLATPRQVLTPAACLRAERFAALLVARGVARLLPPLLVELPDREEPLEEAVELNIGLETLSMLLPAFAGVLPGGELDLADPLAVPGLDSEDLANVPRGKKASISSKINTHIGAVRLGERDKLR